MWLSEGFATYASWIALESIFPDWVREEKKEGKNLCQTIGQDIPSLIFGDLEKGLNRDALKSTHAVEVRR